MANRFCGLTPKQSDTLGRIAFGMGGPMHPKTLKVLLDRGLIVGRDVSLGRDGFGEIIVKEYAVPLAVNAAYCAWCSDHYEANPDDLTHDEAQLKALPSSSPSKTRDDDQ